MACKRSMDCTCAQCAAASAEFSVEDLKQFSSSIKYDEAGDGQEGNDNSNATEAPPKPKPKPRPKPAPKPKPTAVPASSPPIPETGEVKRLSGCCCCRCCSAWDGSEGMVGLTDEFGASVSVISPLQPRSITLHSSFSAVGTLAGQSYSLVRCFHICAVPGVGRCWVDSQNT